VLLVDGIHKLANVVIPNPIQAYVVLQVVSFCKVAMMVVA
jgi:hypothetical protein